MQTQRSDVIPPDTATTLFGLFRERLRRAPEAEAYRYYDPRDRHWKGSTWRATARAVARWQAALAAEGLTAGDRVAVMMRNSLDWVILDQAALGLGLVVVPLYNDDRGDSVAYILEDAGARLLLIEGFDQWDKLAPVADRLASVERIVALDDLASAVAEPRLRWAASWLPAPGEAFDLAAGPTDPDALATIVYTSGTTGRPKGVMLSHRNILANAHNGLRTSAVYPDDLFLSFLPLSHTLERTVGYYLPMMAGATVAFSRSITHLAEDLTSVRPTLLVSVPRVFERVHNRLRDNLAARPVARRLFEAAVAAGWHRFERAQGRAPWHPRLLAAPLLHRLVGRKVMARLGGRVRFAISGGAALPEPVARTFIGLGLTLLQGYGLTEYAPVVSVNRIPRNDPTSVGPALPDTEVATSAEGELLVRGPSVMLGYWGLPEATADKIDAAGWLRTGDRARIDDAGFIRITGRLKEIIVLANGEKVPPEDMESAISMDPVFEQAVVVGESRPYLAALVVVDPEHWRQVAGERCAHPARDVMTDDYCQRLALARIGEDLREFPGYARIRRVAVCEEPWTIDNGLMTPSLKPRRQRILDHFGDKVAAVYAGHDSPAADNQERRKAAAEGSR